MSGTYAIGCNTLDTSVMSEILKKCESVALTPEELEQVVGLLKAANNENDHWEQAGLFRKAEEAAEKGLRRCTPEPDKSTQGWIPGSVELRAGHIVLISAGDVFFYLSPERFTICFNRRSFNLAGEIGGILENFGVPHRHTKYPVKPAEGFFSVDGSEGEDPTLFEELGLYWENRNTRYLGVLCRHDPETLQGHISEALGGGIPVDINEFGFPTIDTTAEGGTTFGLAEQLFDLIINDEQISHVYSGRKSAHPVVYIDVVDDGIPSEIPTQIKKICDDLNKQVMVVFTERYREFWPIFKPKFDHELNSWTVEASRGSLYDIIGVLGEAFFRAKMELLVGEPEPSNDQLLLY